MFRFPTDQELAHRPLSVVTVSGAITEIDPDQRSAQGARHQILSIRVDKIITDSAKSGVAVGQIVNVAMRYGDAVGLSSPLPNLVVGAPITLTGAYITLAAAYGERDGDQNAVIHYTHHPVGWVEYQGKRYE